MKFKKEKFNKKRKHIYLLPNLLTTANFFCGTYSIFLSINGNFSKAAWILFVGMFFDFLDGQAARMQNATTRFGMEYDSLSDLVSFGVAPAILVYSVCFPGAGRIGLAIMFIYSACCALRLARYNSMPPALGAEEGTIKYFSGMPSPGAAGLIASLVVVSHRYQITSFQKVIPIIAICLSYLMISNIKYIKFSQLIILKENHFLALFMIITGISTIIFFPSLFFFLGFSCYTIIGLLSAIFKKYIRNKETVPDSITKDKTVLI